MTLQTAKTTILQKLAQIQSVGALLEPIVVMSYATEGFVATDKIENVVKLVDRLEFSRANFTIAKD